MRFLKLLFLASLSLVAAIAVVAYLLVRGSLPQLEGDATVEGIRAGISIARDGAGVPVITAANRADLAFGTGYVHGQDRFFQMDLSRRRAAGELAELFGALALPLDKANRLHRFRSRARAVTAELSGPELENAAAYTAGVNAGLASLRVRPFEYLLLRTAPDPWAIEDSFLVAYNMFLELHDELADRDISRGLARQVFSAALFDFLYPEGTEWDAPLLGAARVPPPLPPAADFESVKSVYLPRPDDRADLLPGSNNWAVAGALTDSGRAIVANDMHLGITAPGVFYRARLIVIGAGARDLAGVTLPGAPVLVAGSNGHIAWGNTNSYGDWTDAVIVRPGATEGTYATANGDQEIATYEESIAVRNDAPVKMVIRETIWGPVIDDPASPGDLLAISWLAHKAGAVNLRGIDLELAKSTEEALNIAPRIGMPPQNLVIGDAAGNIGWTIAGQIPLRSDYDASLPADWSDGGGWTGWLPADQYPRVLNPASGRIWTANARVVDGAALMKVGDGGYDLGARARQIRDSLFAREKFTPQDMLAIQIDDRALFLARWRDLLLQILDADALRDEPARSEYRRLAENWSARASVESPGYRLVREFRVAVRDRVFDMLMQAVRDRHGNAIELRMSNQFEAPLWTLLKERPPSALSNEYESWRDMLLRAVDANIENFRDNFAGPLEQRTWGERNTATIRHPLSRAVPFLAGWLDMPADQLPGDSNMPRAQGRGFGASERFGVAPGDEANGYLHIPSGQSGHPLSDYYRKGHEDWVNARPTAFLPGVAEHTLLLLPSVAH